MLRSEVEQLIIPLRLSGIPPARSVPEVTSAASSDEEDRKDTRTVGFLTPLGKDGERALISSASSEEQNQNHDKVDDRAEDNKRANSPGDDSGDELRRDNRLEIPQGAGSINDESPPGLGATTGVIIEPLRKEVTILIGAQVAIIE